MAGKLGQGSVNAVHCPGAHAGNGAWLFFAADNISGKRFLVDTRASFSIIPHRSALRPSGPALHTANNMRIRCWGCRTAEVYISGTVFSWDFLLADVRFPILGIDFLRHHQLVVDVCSERLLPRSALAQPIGGDVFTVTSQAAALAAASSEWDQLLAELPGVSRPFTIALLPAHGVEHTIETAGRPMMAKFWRLNPARLAAAKAEFDKMLATGVIRRSSSSWSSPLHMVLKKDGGWQPCGDFRRLNNITAEDKYPLPNMADLSARLDGCVIFSKLDLQKGYYQVLVAATDVAKTAIITPFGLFEFIRMPFGLNNAGMTFQRLMDKNFLRPAIFFLISGRLHGGQQKHAGPPPPPPGSTAESSEQRACYQQGQMCFQPAQHQVFGP
jgi:hypothetical protein